MAAESHKVEFASVFLNVFESRCDFLILEQFVLFAGHIDLYEVLVDGSTCAEVHMSHFGVSHLSVREAYVFSASLEVTEWVFGTKGVNIRSPLCE